MFREFEVREWIEDQFTGQGRVRSRGRFVVVYYSVMNDLNSAIQPATQINYNLFITDDKGRRWETADYTGDYGGLSGDPAVALGYEQPESHVPPGFENINVAVFDIPEDAQNLSLVWTTAATEIILK